MSSQILPGSTIGIVGGGQLGKMLCVAAAQLGYHTHVYCPEGDTPAATVATHHTAGAYDDIETFKRFADEVDVITVEFENISAEGLKAAAALKPVGPSPELLEICQHRWHEKDAINALGVKTAPYAKVTSAKELEEAASNIGKGAGIVKTASMGYDGKGQMGYAKGDDAADAWKTLNCTEAIYEDFVPFDDEISVIVSRNQSGEVRCYVPVLNRHKNHILHTTHAPAPLSNAMAKKAESIALTLAEKLNLVGTLAVEMFVCGEEILVNELAPRPHNSGHWTLDGCVVSQFEQTIRAVCNLPLGDPSRHSNAVMTNLIGDDIKQWKDAMRTPHTAVHLYGKAETRPGRKMGHITQLTPYEE